jgi:hypothetical protein
MVTNVKEEYVAAGIREQVQSLKNIHEEIETERLTSEAIAWRLRAVEIKLKRLREAA